jgi:hypothetical protein
MGSGWRYSEKKVSALESDRARERARFCARNWVSASASGLKNEKRARARDTSI